MSLVAALSEVLCAGACVVPCAKGSILLRDQQSGMCVEVFGLPSSSVAIPVDQFSHFEVIDGLSAPRKRKCDYMLVVERSCVTTVVFVEMKMTYSRNNVERARQQLKWSAPFFDYLYSMCELEGEELVSRALIGRRFVIVAGMLSARLDKRSVGVRDGLTMASDGCVQIVIGTSGGGTISGPRLIHGDYRYIGSEGTTLK